MEGNTFSEVIKIGKICLDMKYYSGKDEYTDGYIEDVILDTCKKHKEEEILNKSTDWPVLYHLSSLRENLLEWFPLKKTQRVLEIGSGCGAITGILSHKAGEVTCVDLSRKRSLINAYRHMDCANIKMIVGNFQDIEPDLGKFDVITLIGVLEYAAFYIKDKKNPFKSMLALVSKHLNENGKLIIAIENKMGLKYWNGAPEDHTGDQYSSLNDYVGDRKIRTFSKRELEEMMQEIGLRQYKFFYPMPDYKLPTEIYSDERQPNVGEIRNFRKEYSKTRFYNFYEDTINDQICRDQVFDYFANSFLILAGKSIEKLPNYIKYNRERKREYRISTAIDINEKLVIKYPLDNMADQHIFNLKINEDKWRHIFPKIHSVNGRIEEGKYISDYIVGDSLDKDFFIVRNDLEQFINKAKDIISTYYIPNDSDLFEFYLTDEYKEVFGENVIANAKSTEVTNIDMIFQNLRKTSDGEVFAFDFEWVFDFPIPNEYVIWRAIVNLYIQYQIYLRNKISLEKFVGLFGINAENHSIYEQMEDHFSDYVSGLNRCEVYTRRYIKPVIMQKFNIW